MSSKFINLRPLESFIEKQLANLKLGFKTDVSGIDIKVFEAKKEPQYDYISKITVVVKNNLRELINKKETIKKQIENSVSEKFNLNGKVLLYVEQYRIPDDEILSGLFSQLRSLVKNDFGLKEKDIRLDGGVETRERKKEEIRDEDDKYYEIFSFTVNLPAKLEYTKKIYESQLIRKYVSILRDINRIFNDHRWIEIKFDFTPEQFSDEEVLEKIENALIGKLKDADLGKVYLKSHFNTEKKVLYIEINTEKGRNYFFIPTKDGRKIKTHLEAYLSKLNRFEHGRQEPVVLWVAKPTEEKKKDVQKPEVEKSVTPPIETSEGVIGFETERKKTEIPFKDLTEEEKWIQLAQDE
ncbi:MAG: hypothetical protein HYW78_03385 [Parcubacteria group bacterium]|nr:hypothetical protein [Parcubacteria group bacterium]